VFQDVSGEDAIQELLLENTYSDEEEGIQISSIENTIDIMPTKIRYVRDWLSGSNKNG
jgi:hypothetical protein